MSQVSQVGQHTTRMDNERSCHYARNGWLSGQGKSFRGAGALAWYTCLSADARGFEWLWRRVRLMPGARAERFVQTGAVKGLIELRGGRPGGPV